MVGLCSVLFTCLAYALAPRPAASIWYRGVPPGVPRADDLELIRAIGFSAVTWPARHAAALDQLRRLAAPLDLSVLVRDTSVTLTPDSLLNPGEQIDVQIASVPAERLSATVWRAIAHGARVVSFDAAETPGTGLRGERGETPAWVRPAAAIARQLDFNGTLIEAMRAGPAVTVDSPAPESLDVRLLETPRAWVVIATNLSDTRSSGGASSQACAVRVVGESDRWIGSRDGQRDIRPALADRSGALGLQSLCRGQDTSMTLI